MVKTRGEGVDVKHKNKRKSRSTFSRC